MSFHTSTFDPYSNQLRLACKLFPQLAQNRTEVTCGWHVCRHLPLALCRILKARNSKATRTVRRFKVPQLNFEVSDYTELINRTDEVTEPPVIMTISDAQLKTSIAEKETPSLFSPRFPCHSQAVERCIKFVTEASTTVSGKRNRNGFIRNKLQS